MMNNFDNPFLDEGENDTVSTDVDKQDKWLTVPQCAEILGISRTTMLTILKKDLTPVLKLNKNFRIKESDFLKVLEKHTTVVE